MIEEQKKENPAEVKENPTDTKPANEVEALLAELKAAGVTSPSQLHGQLSNAREFGNVVNILGDIKAENAALREEVKKRTVPRETTDDYSQEAGQINIGDLVSNAVEKALTTREKRQLEIQQRVTQTWRAIQTDEDFSLVKEIWETKTRDPEFIYQIQTGQIDPVRAYNSTVREYLKRLVKNSADTITNLTGKGAPGAVQPPHLESGGTVPTWPLSKDQPESKGKIKDLHEKAYKGGQITEEEQLSALDAILGG